MPRPRALRRFGAKPSPEPPAGRPAPAPAPDRQVRVVWAAAEEMEATRDAAIGKVAIFGDVPAAGGRVRDIIFERETGEIVAYEIDAGGGEPLYVGAEQLERETPSTLHFAAADLGADEHEFCTLEQLPPAER